MRKSTWYQKLGFYSNPFSIKPAAFHNELFGNAQSINKIIKKMKNSGAIFISGEFGTGKTTLLKKLIAELKGDRFEGKKIIYYNCNQSKRPIDYDKLLINSGNLFGKIFRIRKKNMIIFLDEMQDMCKRDIEKIQEYYRDGFFKLIIFVGKDENIDSIKELEKELKIEKFKLKNMTKIQAVEMIRKRIGNLRFMSDDIIMKIFEKDKNSRNFLKNCEDVCRLSFKKEELEVTEETVKEVLE